MVAEATPPGHVFAVEDPYSEEDEENHANDVAPDLMLPQQLL